MSGCYDSVLYNTEEGIPFDQAAKYKQRLQLLFKLITIRFTILNSLIRLQWRKNIYENVLLKIWEVALVVSFACTFQYNNHQSAIIWEATIATYNIRIFSWLCKSISRYNNVVHQAKQKIQTRGECYNKQQIKGKTNTLYNWTQLDKNMNNWFFVGRIWATISNLLQRDWECQLARNFWGFHNLFHDFSPILANTSTRNYIFPRRPCIIRCLYSHQHIPQKLRWHVSPTTLLQSINSKWGGILNHPLRPWSYTKFHIKAFPRNAPKLAFHILKYTLQRHHWNPRSLKC